MKRKILTILVSMLFLSVIPSVIGVDSESDDREPCLDIGRVYLKGLFLFPHYSGDDLIFFALSLFFIQFTPTERTYGWIRLQWVTLENFTGEFKTGPFHIIGWFFGFLEGGLEIGE